MMPKPLPNSTTVLVLGILSIVLCCCYGIFGLISGAIAFILSNQDTKLYQANMQAYTEASYKNLRAGRICAIIGIVLSALYVIAIVLTIAIFGFSALSDPEKLKEIIEQSQQR
ncbi:MAG: DUF4190 domain-containing protein [Verrucomicrobia bacterium]|nr:DUF4190 domain-containing protein [Cytophagales bacterium]